MTKYYPALILTGYIIVSTRALWTSGQYAFGDLEPVPQSVFDAWHAYIDGWSLSGLGFRTAPTLIHLVQAALLFLSGNNPVIVQRGLIGLVLPLGMASAFFLARYLGLSRSASICCATVAMVNPGTLGDMLGGTEYSTVLGIALLPAVLLASCHLLDRPTLMTASLLGAAVATLLQLYAHGAPLLLIGCSCCLFSYVITRRLAWKGAYKRVAALFGAVVIAGLLAAPLLSASSLLYPIRGANNENVTFSANSIQGFLNDVRYTYAFVTPTLALRLGGVADVLGFSTANSLTNLCGYSVTIWLILGLGILILGRASLPLLIGGSIATVSLAFVVATHYGLTYSTFLRFPALFVYRNPAQPVMFAALGVGLLGGATTDCLRRLGKLGLVSAVLIFGAYFAYIAASPLSGDYFISKYHPGAVIEEAYYDVVRLLANVAQGSYYRVLWLPQSYDEVTIKMRSLPINLVETQYGAAQFYAEHGDKYLESGLSDVASGESRRLGHLLGPLLGLFVVIDRRSKASVARGSPHVISPYGTPYLTGDPERLFALCLSQEDLRLIYQTTRFAVFVNMAMLK